MILKVLISDRLLDLPDGQLKGLIADTAWEAFAEARDEAQRLIRTLPSELLAESDAARKERPNVS